MLPIEIEQMVSAFLDYALTDGEIKRSQWTPVSSSDALKVYEQRQTHKADANAVADKGFYPVSTDGLKTLDNPYHALQLFSASAGYESVQYS